VNITNRELNLINKLPFKDNEEDILFSLYDNNNTLGNFIINNYKTKMSNNNFDNSRNHKNEFTQIKKQYNNTSYNSSIENKSDDKQNNAVFPITRNVIMNNLIWENIKSLMKSPNKNKINITNYNKTMNNFNKNKVINNNINNIFTSKCISSRNQNNIKNLKTEENRAYFKTYNIENNSSQSKDDSFNNIPFENICLLSSPSNLKASYLTTFRSNTQRGNRIENRVSEINKPPLLNLKKNSRNSDFLNIKIKLKKFYSPVEINFMRMSKKRRYVADGNKYSKIKQENFKIKRNDYYKKNLKNRMNYFYGNSPEIKSIQ
jgi:hypothetical protein